MGKASRRKEEREKRKEERKKIASSPGIIPLPPQPLLTRPLPVLLLLALLATAIYSNTFSASFHFDDTRNIAENPKIKHLENFLDLSGSRYVGFLTFALNYYFGGLHVFGYHLVNLLIHITNGFLVYTLVLLLFKASSYNFQLSTLNSQSSNAPWIALSTALLFIAHPLQTQAVTYIVQRFASLAALFYLLAVVCYLKWRLSIPRPEGQKVERSKGIASAFSPLDLWTFRPFNLLWYIGALFSTILAMKTKENSFTLPLMLLLVEAVFFRPLTLKRWRMLIPFLLTLPLIPLSHPGAIDAAEAGFAQETTEISRGDYLLTQFRVIVTYIRLLFLPVHQNLDYDYPIYHSLFDPPVFSSFLFLGSLFALAVYLLLRSQLSTLNFQLIAFGLLWFFLTLSVESSIIPIRDVIFEHRVYLPIVGLLLTVVAIGFTLLKQFEEGKLRDIVRYGSTGLFVGILVIASLATYNRNQIWTNSISLWEDVARRSPGKARAHRNLGSAYFYQKQIDKSIQEYQAAIKLNANYATIHNDLGLALREAGRWEEAVREFETALKFFPEFTEAHNNLGMIYEDKGRFDEAIKEYKMASNLDPNDALVHNNLGSVLRQRGKMREAFEEIWIALSLKPEYPEAHNNLGLVYYQQGKLEEAMTKFKAAIKLKPDYAAAHNNVGLVYYQQGRLADAALEFQEALKLKPDYAEPYSNLGSVYAQQRRFPEAIEQFKMALKRNPENADAHYNLGLAYLESNQIPEARGHLQQALHLKPDLNAARQALEALPD